MEELISELESTGNFLRGMSFDKRLPKDTLEAIVYRVKRLDDILEIYKEEI